MAKVQQDEWDDLDIPEAPIIPTEKDENKYISSGWKFYVKVRKDLPEYWEEFNGAVSKNGRPKYKSVKDFIKTKYKRQEDKDLFYIMVAPYQEWELLSSVDHGKSNKKVIPWLGDWYKRRKNGYWQEPNVDYIKSVKKSIKENLDANQAIRSMAPFFIRDLLRIERLIGKVDEAFGGNPYLVDHAGDSSANKKRFEIYVSMIAPLMGLKAKAAAEVMRTHGVNPAEPNQMWNMAQIAQQFGQIGAAGALTGAAAAGGILLSNPNGAPTMLSRDTLLLADHITQHTKDFADVPEKVVTVLNPLDKDKPKTNGKHITQ